MEPQISADKRG